MITKFGKQIRKDRIDKVVTLRAMADSMGISPAYLSAIENGKRSITPQLFTSIVKFFRFNPDERDHLQNLADISQKEITISMRKATEKQRDSVASFARRLNTLTDEDLEKINDILGKK